MIFVLMSTFIAILAILLGVAGIVGSIVPGLPGPPLSWLGMMVLYFWGAGTNGEGAVLGGSLLLLWLVITVVVTIIDYVVPAWFTKVTGGSKYGGWGAIIGLILGMSIPPVGMIVGALLGAFAAELIFAKKDTWTSVKSALGAFLGFLSGTGIKLIASGIMFYYIIVFAF